MGLFGPIWKTGNANKVQKAVEAVGGIDDIRVLQQIAQEARLPAVAEAAINRIDDPFALKALAIHFGLRPDDASTALMIATLHRIMNQDVLTDLAVRDDRISLKAVERVTGDEALAQIAKAARCPGVMKAAVDRIADPALLASIAMQKDHPARLAAISRVSDPAVLADIALKADEPTALSIVNRLTDDAALVRIASDSGLALVCRAAGQRIRGDAALLGLVLNGRLTPDSVDVNRLLNAADSPEALEKLAEVSRYCPEAFRASIRQRQASLLRPAAEKARREEWDRLWAQRAEHPHGRIDLVCAKCGAPVEIGLEFESIDSWSTDTLTYCESGHRAYLGGATGDYAHLKLAWNDRPRKPGDAKVICPVCRNERKGGCRCPVSVTAHYLGITLPYDGHPR